MIAGDAIRFLEKHFGDPFDLILADPPLRCGDWRKIFWQRCARRTSSRGGLVVFQAPQRLVPGDGSGRFRGFNSREGSARPLLIFCNGKRGREESDV